MNDKNHHDTDPDFVGYVSWIGEVGLFFFTLAACSALVWLGWVVGKGAGFWS